jgi:hypothetical protein
VTAEHSVAQAFRFEVDEAEAVTTQGCDDNSAWTANINPLRGLQGTGFLNDAEVTTADCKSVDETWFLLMMQPINPLRGYNDDVTAEHNDAQAFRFELTRQRL